MEGWKRGRKEGRGIEKSEEWNRTEVKKCNTMDGMKREENFKHTHIQTVTAPLKHPQTYKHTTLLSFYFLSSITKQHKYRLTGKYESASKIFNRQ